MARQDEKQAEGNAAEGKSVDMTKTASDNASQQDGGARSRRGLHEPARVAAEDYSGPVIGFVRETLTGTVAATGAVATDAVGIVRDVLTDTMHATEEVGTEALGLVGTIGTGIVSTARDILVGGVGGIREILGSAVPGRAGSAEREPLHAREHGNP